MNWIPVFKKGKHIASSGAEFDATEEKLDKIIEMNKGREYPLAIGHPKTSSPAYGWANELKRVGDILYAKPKSMVSEFETWVQKKLWKNISLSMNPDLTIRHIGFLGATPPAIEGLAAEFNEDDKALVFEFSTADMPMMGKMKQMLSDMMSKMQDMMSQMPEDDAPAQTAFSKTKEEDDMSKTVQELEVELAAKISEFSALAEKDKTRATEIETLKVDLLKERQKGQVAEFSAFLSSDAMKKKVSPVMKTQLLGILEFAAATETYEFSAPDPTDATKTVKIKKAPLDAIKEFCRAHLPDIIEFEEVAKKDKAAGAGGDMTDPQEIAKKAVEFQRDEEKAGRTITIDQAVTHVTMKK